MANKIQKEVMVSGGGGKETFKFGFYNLLKYFIMNVGHLIKIDIFR